jgi:hypothetical protein
MSVIKKCICSHQVNQALILFCIVGIIAIGWLHTQPPAVNFDKLTAQDFSAKRAFHHIKQIAHESHATGTQANAKVNNYLIDQLKVLGLRAYLQSELVVDPLNDKVGRVHNIIVRVKGSKSGKAVLLAAHYDSVPTGPGAADDAASVAAILEVLRTLITLPALTNDVICLLTDGEEVGLLGAKAFVESHPWAKDVGLALNFEYRGNRGAVMMFETSNGNGKLIEGLASAAPGLLANSLMYEVYKHLPNDTDFTVFKHAGMFGMNFAAIEGHPYYHTQIDTADNLDLLTLQQQGQAMLGLVRYFGNWEINNLSAQDRIYFDLPGIGIIHYQQHWQIIQLVLLCVVTLSIVVLKFRSRPIRWLHMFASLVAFGAMVVLLSVFNHYVWFGIRRIYPEYDSFAQGEPYNSHWYFLAFISLTVSLYLCLQNMMLRRLKRYEYHFGIIFVWLLLTVSVAIVIPGAAYVLIWPLLTLLLVKLGLCCFDEQKIPVTIYVVYAISLIPGLLIFTPLIYGMYVGLTPNAIGMLSGITILFLGVLTPALHALKVAKLLQTLCLPISFFGFLMASLTAGFSTEQPRQSNLVYLLDKNQQKAYWMSYDKHLNQWTVQFFSKQTPHIDKKDVLTEFSSKRWLAEAPIYLFEEPSVEIVKNEVIDNLRRLTLNIQASPLAPEMHISTQGNNVVASWVDGKPYTTSPVTAWKLNAYGLNAEPTAIQLITANNQPLNIKIREIFYSLPLTGKQKQPEAIISKPGSLSHMSVIDKVFTFY